MPSRIPYAPLALTAMAALLAGCDSGACAYFREAVPGGFANPPGTPS